MRGLAGIFNCTVSRSFKYGMNQFVFFWAILKNYSRNLCVSVYMSICFHYLPIVPLCLPAAALGNENTFSVASSVKTCLNERLSTSERQWGFSKERIRKCINRMLFSLKRKKKHPTVASICDRIKDEEAETF